MPILAFVISAFLALTLLFFRMTRKTYPGFGLWTAGVSLVSVGYLFWGFRGYIPDSISILVLNASAPLAIVLQLAGMRRFLELTPMSRLWYALPVGVVTAAAAFYYGYESIVWRTLIVSSAVCLPHWAMAFLLLRRPVRLESKLYVVIGSFLALGGAIVLGRAIWAFFSAYSHPFLDSPVESVFFISIIVLQIGGTLAFLMLNSERVENELLETEAGLRLAVDRLQESLAKGNRAEATLNASEKRYRDLVENANDIIYRTDANGFFELFNPVGLRITGYSQEEISRKHYLDLIHPDYKKQVERFYGLQFVKRIPDTYYEVPIINKEGKTVWIGQSVQLVMEGNTTVGFQSIARDITDRKMAEKSLRKSEERLQLALDGGDLGLWDLDIRTGHAVTNQRAAEIVGYSLDEIEQSFSSWESFIHPDDRQKALEPYFNHLAGLTDFSEAEYRARHKSGEWRWIHARGKITERDPDGNPVRMTGTFLDITDRKLAESRAAEAKEFAEKIVSASPVGIAVFQADGQCISANDALGRIVGADKERLMTQNFRDLAPWKDSGLLADAERVLSEGISTQREVYLTSLFGKTVWVASRMARFTFGGEHHLLLLFNDISKRRTAEDTLKFEREQLLSLFESINEVILVIDPRTYEILFANRFTEDMYGKQLIGGLCYEKLGGIPGPCSHCINEQIVALQGRPYQWEYSSRVLKRDFLATDRMIRWPDGRDVKFQIAIDITERKEAAQEQDSLRAQLFQAQKMEAVGTLAGGIAHDFNNLLTVVQGFSELLLAEKDQEHPEYDDLQKIFHAAKNGADLVQRLLMFSRKSEPKPVPLNLNSQIVQIEKLLRRTIPRMIDVHLDLSVDLPQINADPSQIEQIVMNLAVNARDAMSDAGKLTLRTSMVTLDEEYCRLHVGATPGEYVLLEVSDTGHGMDKDTVEHIFEPFFTTKARGRGTGLGLAMVYGIVKQHNGHITVQSQVDRGTTFGVYLPAIPDEMEPDVEDSGTMPAFGTETLLLVDDEDFVRELGARILTKQGYTVLQAANGRDGLDLFKRERSRISLVILDLIMPEMGGMECLKELVTIDPNVKILVASGYSADTSVKETVQMGARGFVTKPFRVKELLREVRSILDNA
ncbi:MAG: PAS domain S-box protein [Thermodesulfobacteriota bacterium]